MDRLAESSRLTLTNRSEAIDFTRTNAARTERRDDVEARADERVNERDKQERAHEKPERFAVHLEEQKAAIEPQTSDESPAETKPAPDAEPEVEASSGKPEEEPQVENAAPQKNVSAAPDLQLEPEPVLAAPELQSADEAALKIETPKAAAPLPLVPAALPAVTNAAQPTGAAEAPEIRAAIETAPLSASERTVVDVESANPKIGAARAEAGVNPAQTSAQNTETLSEPPKLEAAREAPAARSAHEVERAAEILRQIRVQLTPQLSEARIQLHPIELGRVSIHLTVEGGRMKTVVRAEKTETLQAIQTHLPELRASLRQHGIDAQEFQLMLGFENRERRDADKAPTPSSTRNGVAESAALERSPSLHAAVTQTGIDFYA